MKTKNFTLALLCALVWSSVALATTATITPQAVTAQGSLSDTLLSDLLRQQLTQHPQHLRLRAPGRLAALYAERGYRPLWLPRQTVTPTAHEMLRAIADASNHGLRPGHYHHDVLAALLNREPVSTSLPQLGQIELLLSDAFFSLGSDLLNGRVDPRRLDHRWPFAPSDVALDTTLTRAVTDNTVAASLAALAPQYPAYLALQASLAIYRDYQRRQQAWPAVRRGSSLKLGVADDRVVELRQRLRASGDLSPAAPVVAAGAAPETVFDQGLEQAVIRFQRQHGLEPDGVVGPRTLAALNVPLSERVRQLELNLERWRWLPESLGERYILVNIAGFEMRVIDNGRPVFYSPVIVGRPDRKTPLLSSRLNRVVLSPYWHVPFNIATRDKLPLLRRNPNALRRQKIRVFNGRGREVDPRQVNWHGVNRGYFPYRLRQDPGPRNALGKVKFLFDNPYNVYLHDTSTPRLFGEAQRGFSSGCVRVAKPLELAKFLLSANAEWDSQRIERLATAGRERTVALQDDNAAAALPVHLLYWTAWQAEDGSVQFRNDIYRRDGRLEQALAALDL